MPGFIRCFGANGGLLAVSPSKTFGRLLLVGTLRWKWPNDDWWIEHTLLSQRIEVNLLSFWWNCCFAVIFLYTYNRCTMKLSKVFLIVLCTNDLQTLFYFSGLRRRWESCYQLLSAYSQRDCTCLKTLVIGYTCWSTGQRLINVVTLR